VGRLRKVSPRLIVAPRWCWKRIHVSENTMKNQKPRLDEPNAAGSGACQAIAAFASISLQFVLMSHSNRKKILFHPASIIWLASREDTATEGEFPINFCLRSAWDAACRPHNTTKQVDPTVCGVSRRVFGHTFPVASSGFSRSGRGSGHAATAVIGGPRRPFIRPRIPAKTCLGSAASAI